MECKRKFALKEYSQLVTEGKKFRLETKNKKKVEIFKTDVEGPCPIFGLIDRECAPCSGWWNKKGAYLGRIAESDYDLFIIIEETENIRPYTFDELKEEILKRGVFLQADHFDNAIATITYVDELLVEVRDMDVDGDITFVAYSLEQMLTHYKWLNGDKFGKLVEEEE